MVRVPEVSVSMVLPAVIWRAVAVLFVRVWVVVVPTKVVVSSGRVRVWLVPVAGTAKVIVAAPVKGARSKTSFSELLAKLDKVKELASNSLCRILKDPRSSLSRLIRVSSVVGDFGKGKVIVWAPVGVVAGVAKL
jgi:hypothetical protein